jgi:hypothetical protein
MNAQSQNAGRPPTPRKRKAAIANLPSGIGVNKVSNGKTDFWRVRLGKRFTGGAILTKHFADLADARNWIFGGAQKQKAEPGSVLHLSSATVLQPFALSPAQITEAAWAASESTSRHLFDRCCKVLQSAPSPSRSGAPYQQGSLRDCCSQKAVWASQRLLGAGLAALCR